MVNVDATFRALGDATRRQLVERLCAGPASMSELLEPFEMSLPALSKHLGVLEACGLVQSTKEGRVRTFRVVSKRLEAAETWLSKQRSMWERRLDQLEEHLQQMEKDTP